MPAPRVVVVDNYDSFVYNLVQYLGELGAVPHVVRNDETTAEVLLDDSPDAIVVVAIACCPPPDSPTFTILFKPK